MFIIFLILLYIYVKGGKFQLRATNKIIMFIIFLILLYIYVKGGKFQLRVTNKIIYIFLSSLFNEIYSLYFIINYFICYIFDIYILLFI